MLKVGSMISEKTCRLNVYSLVVNLSRGWGHCNQFSSNNASILLYFSKQVPAFFAMDLHCGVENGSNLIYFLVANIYFVYNGDPGNGLRSPAQCRNGPHGLSWLWTLGPLALHGKYLVKCGPRGMRPGHTCCGAHLDGRSGQLEDWAPVCCLEWALFATLVRRLCWSCSPEYGLGSWVRFFSMDLGFLNLDGEATGPL